MLACRHSYAYRCETRMCTGKCAVAEVTGVTYVFWKPAILLCTDVLNYTVGWTTINATLTTGVGFFSAVTLGNYIYMFGGLSNDGVISTIHRFATGSDTMSTAANTPIQQIGMQPLVVPWDFETYKIFETYLKRYLKALKK